MMTVLAKAGKFAFNNSHCSKASYDLSDLIKILEIFLGDFEDIDLEGLKQRLNEIKDPERTV